MAWICFELMLAPSPGRSYRTVFFFSLWGCGQIYIVAFVRRHEAPCAYWDPL